MSELFAVVAIFVAYLNVRNKLSPVLPLLISFEFSLSHLTTSIFIDYNMYSIDNMPAIIVARMIILLPASYIIIKYKINHIWSIIGVIYSAVFLYNGLTLVQLSFSSAGFFMSNYTIFMRLSMIFLMLCLSLHSWGGGIKNYLGSRLYFVNRGDNYTDTASQNLFARINRFWSKP